MYIIFIFQFLSYKKTGKLIKHIHFSVKNPIIKKAVMAIKRSLIENSSFYTTSDNLLPAVNVF